MNVQLSGKVLVVEDNLVNQKLTCSILNKLGLTFEVAHNGEEAITLWQDNSFDLILMDCQMPVMNGYLATEEIRRKESSSHIPIIALTANAMENDDIRCKDAGMDDFLSKPFAINDLISILQKWLDITTARTMTGDTSLGLDYAAINELKESLQDDFYEIVQIYIKSSNSILEQMEQACNSADHQEVQRLAHSIKSSSANLGVIKLSSLAADLENQILKNDFSNIKEKIDELQKLFTLSEPTLKSF